MIPQKRLLTKQDLELWNNAPTNTAFLQFIQDLADSVVGLENSQTTIPISESVKATDQLFNSIQDIINSNPVAPHDVTKSRFGKPEFKGFYDEVAQQASTILKKCYPQLINDQIDELNVYLVNSWGNKQRIDYGSGHELNFMCFLYGLSKFNIFNLSTDATNIVLIVFRKYRNIMRTLETEYWLEPAGSHGVWGLDDYHFLPFLFGAFQLSTHKHLKPISIHNSEVVDMFKDKYMYFGCIAFINSVKTTTSLRWHSPMLDDISGVKRWSKVAEGMVKMYRIEVLGKLPIMQHFYFGSFLPCPDGISPPNKHSECSQNDEEDDEAHSCESGPAHLHSTWGDCCGIKVPSAIAATAMKGINNHKPIPFD